MTLRPRHATVRPKEAYMTASNRRVFPVVICVAIAIAAADTAAAQTRMVKAPATLTQPGAYVLERSHESNDATTAITIAGNYITLDLNGHTLVGPGNKQGVGVSIANASGVRVSNGVIAGFGIGVEVQGSSHVALEALHITGQDQGGPPPSIEIGIMVVNSRAVVVTDNTISRTFLGVFVRGGGSSGNRLARNTIVGGQNGQIGICYNPDTSGSPAAPTGDLVSGNLIARFNVGIQTSTETRRNIFRENDIAHFMQAIQEVTPNSNVLERNTSVQIAR